MRDLHPGISALNTILVLLSMVKLRVGSAGRFPAQVPFSLQNRIHVYILRVTRNLSFFIYHIIVFILNILNDTSNVTDRVFALFSKL